MSLILQVLTGTFPPFLARRKTPRKRSPEYLEAARIYWRQRRAAQTKEDRDAEYLRKKEILASLSDQERARRLGALTDGFVRIDFTVEPHAGGGRLIVEVLDSGAGFDVQRVLSRPSLAHGLSGRGLNLVQRLASNARTPEMTGPAAKPLPVSRLAA